MTRGTGAELLWEADPAYLEDGTRPDLVSECGEDVPQYRARINGTQYPTSQHGFARDHAVLNASVRKDDAASFLLGIRAKRRKEVYPFDFELVIVTYTLQEKQPCGLNVGGAQSGRGGDVLHDRRTSGVPVCESRKRRKSDYILKFPGQERAQEYILIDPSEAAADPAESTYAGAGRTAVSPR